MFDHYADEIPIWWFAPFFDGSSFGKEATTAILGLIRWALHTFSVGFDAPCRKMDFNSTDH